MSSIVLLLYDFFLNNSLSSFWICSLTQCWKFQLCDDDLLPYDLPTQHLCSIWYDFFILPKHNLTPLGCKLLCSMHMCVLKTHNADKLNKLSKLLCMFLVSLKFQTSQILIFLTLYGLFSSQWIITVSLPQMFASHSCFSSSPKWHLHILTSKSSASKGTVSFCFASPLLTTVPEKQEALNNCLLYKWMNKFRCLFVEQSSSNSDLGWP